MTFPFPFRWLWMAVLVLNSSNGILATNRDEDKAVSGKVGGGVGQEDDWIDPMDIFSDDRGDQDSEDHYWIDPMDMGLEPTRFENPFKKKQVKEEGGGVKVASPAAAAAAPSPIETDKLKAEIARLEELVKNLNSTAAKTPSSYDKTPATGATTSSKKTPPSLDNNIEQVFLVRFANVLVNALGLRSDEFTDRGLETNARIVLNAGDVRVLRDFAAAGAEKRRGHPADLDAVLSTFIAYTFPDDPLETHYIAPLRKYLPTFDDQTLLRTMTIVLVSYWVYSFMQGQYRTLLGSMFLVSVFWHWAHMYKRVVSDKHTKLTKTMRVPKECTPGAMSWHELLWDRLTVSDACKEYHDAVLIDPLIEVSPTMAVVETASAFFLHPLQHLGQNLGKFFRALTDELSWMNTPFVLAFVFVLILLLAMMTFKYRIDLPIFLASFGPSNQLEVQRLTLQNEQLTAIKSELEARLEQEAASTAAAASKQAQLLQLELKKATSEFNLQLENYAKEQQINKKALIHPDKVQEITRDFEEAADNSFPPPSDGVAIEAKGDGPIDENRKEAGTKLTKKADEGDQKMTKTKEDKSLEIQMKEPKEDHGGDVSNKPEKQEEGVALKDDEKEADDVTVGDVTTSNELPIARAVAATEEVQDLASGGLPLELVSCKPVDPAAAKEEEAPKSSRSSQAESEESFVVLEESANIPRS